MVSKYTLGTEEDEEQVLGLLLVAQEETPYKDLVVDVDALRNTVAQWLSGLTDTHIIKAQEDNGNIVGILIFQVTDKYSFLPGIKIQQELFFFVLPEYRGSRVAMKLKSLFEQNGLEIGCELLTMGLMSNQYEPLLNKVYTKSGFTPTERIYTKRIN